MKNAKVLLSFLIFILASSCGIGNLPSSKNDISNFQDSLQTMIDSELVKGDDLPGYLLYSNAILQDIKFVVKKIDQESKSAVVEFSYVDAMKLADSYSGPLSDAEQYYNYCVNEIMNDRAHRVEKEVTFSYCVAESDCLIETNQDYLDVISGGAYSAYLEMLEGEDIA